MNYWEWRQELFGPEKFALCMSLSDALCDDLVAIKACVFRPLPHLDASGRQLLLAEPRLHTKEGYTTESMVRNFVWSIIIPYVHGYKLVHVCHDTSDTNEFLLS